MEYLLLKSVHVGCAAISVTGFVLRWLLMTNGSDFMARRRLLRITPHIVDTLFLLSGIALAVMLGQLPFRNGWLTAKVIGLVAYILLGVTAMSQRNSGTVRVAAFVLALLTFSWIVSVAWFKNAWGYFAL